MFEKIERNGKRIKKGEKEMKVWIIIGMIILIAISGCIDGIYTETPRISFNDVDCHSACIEYAEDNNLEWKYCTNIDSETIKCGFREIEAKGKTYKVVKGFEKTLLRIKEGKK